MPKLPTVYSRTVIYKITCLDKNIEYSYVGSTTDFTQRKKLHKSSCNNKNAKTHNLKLYTTIRENGGWLNWTMIQIEEYPCNNKREAECREEYWRVELNAQLNMKKAFGAETKAEYQKIYRDENKDAIKEQKKHYYKTNKDEIKEQMKQYREEHKDEIKEQKKHHYETNKNEIKEQMKQYYQTNKEAIKERSIQFREENKEAIKERSRQYRNENKEEINKRKREQYQLKKQLLQENKSNV